MRYLSTLSLLLFCFVSCMESEPVEDQAPVQSFESAVAVVYPVGESEVSGTVNFETVDDGVSVSAEISGLNEGKHGFHIHQYGDCTASDGTSAGGHFNPKGNEHSAPADENRHMGDMGNITADANGIATVSYTDKEISLGEVIGRAVVVHAGEDDLNSQPSGDAGSRVGCGVIGIQD